MKKVVLLGDSIRQIGYGNPVAEALKDEFTVWQPNDNCRFAQYTLRGMWDWAGEINGADIVHWNNGLWDVCKLYGDGEFTPIDVYVDFMVRIAKILLSRCGKVIFATTTPVAEANPHNDNPTIARYNAAVVPELEKLGVIINDLGGAVSRDIDRYICDDLIHLSPEGIELCRDMVVDAVRKAAE